MAERIDFRDQIAKNRRNSLILMVSIFLVFMLLSYVIAMVYDPSMVFLFLIIGIVFSLVYIVAGYNKSADIALASVKAKPAEGPEYRRLRGMVEGLAIASGLPKPKVYVMDRPDINAFATGKDPEHAVVCVTSGSMKKLTDSELEAVLAHEMSHIANYDIRFVTLVAVLVGMVAIISEVFLRSLWFTGGSRDNDRNNIVFLIIGIALAILAPIVVKLVQLAISRKREFMADAGAVKLTRYNESLIGALKKISAESGKPVKTPKAVAPMFFADPLKSKVKGLFMTHPPAEQRIAVLEKM